MKTLLATAAVAVLALSPCAFAQDSQHDRSQSDMTAYTPTQPASDVVVSPNADNLPRVPGAPRQPGDPDVPTDNYTATHQPPLGTAGAARADAVPDPSATGQVVH
jgi:hypothetical protein